MARVLGDENGPLEPEVDGARKALAAGRLRTRSFEDRRTGLEHAILALTVQYMADAMLQSNA